MENYIKKLTEIGIYAKSLMELHLEKPEEFNSERILDELIKVYENLELYQSEIIEKEK